MKVIGVVRSKLIGWLYDEPEEKKPLLRACRNSVADIPTDLLGKNIRMLPGLIRPQIAASRMLV